VCRLALMNMVVIHYACSSSLQSPQAASHTAFLYHYSYSTLTAPFPSPSVASTCFLQTPTDTDDFRNFSYNDVFFHQHFCSVIDNDDRVSKR